MKNILIIKGIINKDSLDNQERTFKSWGSVEMIDKQGDFLNIDEFKPVIEKLNKLGHSIPVMDSHSNHQIGVITNIEYGIDKENRKGLLLTGKIFSRYPSDDSAWEALKSGEYSGMSLGGKAGEKIPVCDQNGCYNILKNIEVWEFSLVATPANPGALVTEFNKLAKSDKSLNFSEDDAKRIGDKLKIDWNTISLKEFTIGINTELEHGTKNPKTNITDNNEEMTAKIAWCHMLETPNYYSSTRGLPAMEKRLKEGSPIEKHLKIQKAKVYVKTPLRT